MTDVNGVLYFAADDGTHGRELWRSDGTVAGTYMALDINPGPGASNPNGLLLVGGTVYLGADDGIHGNELMQIFVQDSVAGTAGADTVTLKQDADHAHIDWTIGTTTGQFPINDPAGLTITGNGGNDIITLSTVNGNPLPTSLHLNGTFTINGLQGSNPLAGTTLEMGRSTVFISYGGASPAAGIRSALAAGYNSGAWNGSSANGAITSSAAASNSNHNTAVGWSDSADGTGINTTPNSIELKYTLVGDVNLDGAVNITDVNALVPHYNSSGAWTGGDFNYDGLVNITDVNALVPNYNTSLGSQVQPALNTQIAPTTTQSSALTAEAVSAGESAANVAGEDLGKGRRRRIGGTSRL